MSSCSLDWAVNAQGVTGPGIHLIRGESFHPGMPRGKSLGSLAKHWPSSPTRNRALLLADGKLRGGLQRSLCSPIRILQLRLSCKCAGIHRAQGFTYFLGSHFTQGESSTSPHTRNRAWLLWPMANFALRSPTVGVNSTLAACCRQVSVAISSAYYNTYRKVISVYGRITTFHLELM